MIFFLLGVVFPCPNSYYIKGERKMPKPNSTKYSTGVNYDYNCIEDGVQDFGECTFPGECEHHECDDCPYYRRAGEEFGPDGEARY
jgi:hypothetical protein